MTSPLARWMGTLCLALVSILGVAHSASSQTEHHIAICHKESGRQAWTLTVKPRDEARQHLATHPTDGQPDNPVPGQSGYVFDAACNLVSECSCVALGDQPLWGSGSISENCLQAEADIDRMIQVANLAEVWYLSGQWTFTDRWLRNPSKDIALPSKRQTCRLTH